MYWPNLLRASLLALTFVTLVPACKNYATATTRRLSYEAVTPAGQIIATTLNQRPAAEPLVQLGRYLDAAASAAGVLKGNPGNTQALKDYNFAVSRAAEVVETSGMEPWKTPVICPGANGPWRFSYKPSPRPDLNPTLYRVQPADQFDFKGELVTERKLKKGLGAPLIINSKGFDPTKFDRFAQGKQFYYGMTAVFDFKGRRCEASLLDPLATETVNFDGHTYPLAADFTAPLALALADLKPRKTEVKRMFKPEEYKNSARLARLEPYDPKKIPLLCIHGLGDSQATWAPMIETLRADATFRAHYQIWFFSYPTGYPYPMMAAELREQLDAMDNHYPDHKPLVVVGHSMGGMIARTLITDSQLRIWKAFFETPPARTPFSPEAREIVTKALIFKHRPEIARVIFASASLGGSEMATSFMGRLGAALIGNPDDELSEVGKELAVLSKARADGRQLKKAPNSLDTLDPDNRFITTINGIPPVKGIPFHSIMGDRGKGGNLNRTEPQSTDGLVPYWSSHIDGARSELIVPSNHWSNQHPQAIAEVKRILMLHLKATNR